MLLVNQAMLFIMLLHLILLWTRSSDLHKKTNIENTDIGLSFINELQPVTFNWRPNNEFPDNTYKDYSETEQSHGNRHQSLWNDCSRCRKSIR